MKSAKIFRKGEFAGVLRESDEGYSFSYDAKYLANPQSQAISLTMPLSQKEFVSSTFFPFFDGLIPEGWLLSFATENWKLNPNDRMSLLLACCKDCIGSISVQEIGKEE